MGDLRNPGHGAAAPPQRNRDYVVVVGLRPSLLRDVQPGFKEQLLQRFVEFPNRLVFGDSNVALKPLHVCIRSSRHRIRELGFAASGRTFYQQRLVHAGGQIDNLQRHRIDEVTSGTQLVGEFGRRSKQVVFSCGLDTTPELTCSYSWGSRHCTRLQAVSTGGEVYAEDWRSEGMFNRAA